MTRFPKLQSLKIFPVFKNACGSIQFSSRACCEIPSLPSAYEWIGNTEPKKFGETKSPCLPILRSPQTNFELDQSPMGLLKAALRLQPVCSIESAVLLVASVA